MMPFLLAHGVDTGPLQKPLLAGALSGLAATVPGGAAFVALGSFSVVADEVMRLPRPLTAAVLVSAFTLSGVLYGLIFRRGANDRRGGWLFGAAFSFVLWMAAPVFVLPLTGAGSMAAGRAATGFFVCFLIWGFAIGGLFPVVHQRLKPRLEAMRRGSAQLGPSGAAAAPGLLRRAFHAWH